MGAPRIIPLENYLLYFTKSPDIKPYIVTLEDRKSVKKIINSSFLKVNKIDKRFYFKSLEYCYYRPENQLESVEENWFLKKEIELLKFSDPLEYLKIDSTQRYLDCYDDIYVLGKAINKVVRLENIAQEDKLIARQNKYRELFIKGKKGRLNPKNGVTDGLLFYEGQLDIGFQINDLGLQIFFQTVFTVRAADT